MSASKVVIVFDLYGTLVSTESMATHLGKLCDDKEKAKKVSDLWRKYQLEYSWRITAMGLYRSFSEITEAALQHAAAEVGVSLRPEHVVSLMQDYDSLDSYPEVECALDALSAAPEPIDCYVFSNGAGAQIHACLARPASALARHAALFKGEVSVEETHAFKPDRRVYDHLLREVGREGREEEVWLVTANPFDVVGARARGLEAVWVDRAGTGWMDRLGDAVGGIRPSAVVSGVDRAVIEIMNHAGFH